MGVTIIRTSDKCATCGRMRKFHGPRGECPIGKGDYATDRFFSAVPRESAILKNRIRLGQLYMDARGANHGLEVVDLRPHPTGDKVVARNITPNGRGSLVTVCAQEMAEVSHYEAEPPKWAIPFLTPGLRARSGL